ncbi:MAG: GGDEF domain-containing protein [Desulfobacteraceae bacterium]|nr:MAG: GGDEF domain-containing protein [Desulfobacteraceae bacterium]
MNISRINLSEKLYAMLSVFFGFAQRQADHKKLNRHILALNQKENLAGIIDEVSLCLKSILNYRLFAFVLEKGDGVDVWLDPRMYRKSLEGFILKDFNLKSPDQLNYINQTFVEGEVEKDFGLNQLISYDLNESSCKAKIYMLPSKTMFDYHDEIIYLVLQSAAVALSRQIDIENLKESAVIDPLTGCYNRREFENHLNRQIAGAFRHKTPLSLFMFDLDHFKRINDTYGHLAGDEVLKEVVSAVKRNIRAQDTLARYGGEEFIAILPQTDKTKAMELADRLRQIISTLRIKSQDHQIRVTASFGVAQLDHHADMNRLIHDADTMLYKAKLNGRNTVMPGLMKLCQSEECQPAKEFSV